MTSTVFVNSEMARRGVIDAVGEMPLPFISKLSKGRKRSVEQNAYLWGVCYKTILQQAGEALAGWEPEDLHQYFLGEHFGWETLEGFGRKRMKPMDRSSTLSKLEFAEYVEFIQRRAAQYGVVIPDPE